jgi:hypothetical protein
VAGRVWSGEPRSSELSQFGGQNAAGREVAGSGSAIPPGPSAGVQFGGQNAAGREVAGSASAIRPGPSARAQFGGQRVAGPEVAASGPAIPPGRFARAQFGGQTAFGPNLAASGSANPPGPSSGAQFGGQNAAGREVAGSGAANPPGPSAGAQFGGQSAAGPEVATSGAANPPGPSAGAQFGGQNAAGREVAGSGAANPPGPSAGTQFGGQSAVAPGAREPSPSPEASASPDENDDGEPRSPILDAPDENDDGEPRSSTLDAPPPNEKPVPWVYPQQYLRFAHATWDGLSALVTTRAVSMAAATGTIIPLFTFLLFLMKFGYALIPDRIRKRKVRPNFDYWSWLYCGHCAKRVYVVYFSEDWPIVNFDCVGLCNCQNCFIRVEPGEAEPDSDGQRWFYHDLSDMMERYDNKVSFVRNDTFRYFAQWNHRKNRPSEGMTKDAYLAWAYSDSARALVRRVRKHSESMEAFITHLPGYVKVIVDDLGPDGKPHTDYVFKGHDILTLIWIPSWALEASRRAASIQFDCSFKATRPFVFCVPQAIIQNQAVPLGLVMAPSESGFAYVAFIKELRRLDPGLALKPILSDQHKALDFLCKLYTIPHFYCHCHLIRKWGAGHTLGIMAAQALRLMRKDDFLARRQQWIEDLPALVGVHLIDQQHSDAFEAWLSDPFHDGIWDRVGKGIGRCSNHAERFHGTVNARIKLEGVKTLHGRLAVLRDAIIEEFEGFPNQWSRQVESALDVLRKRADPQVQECDDPDCAAYCRWMCNLFGLSEWACSHTVRDFRVGTPNIPPLDLTKDKATFDGFREPLCVTRSQYLASIVRPEERQECQEVLHPHTSKKEKAPPRQRVEIDLSEEAAPQEHIADGYKSCPCYDNIREIVTGVIVQRKNAKRLPRIDNTGSVGLIFVHFYDAFREGEFDPTPLPNGGYTPRLASFLAGYKAVWWHWAITGQNCPRPGGLPLARKGVLDPIASQGPVIRTVNE